MFLVFRPSFEVVREGRMYQLGPLQNQIVTPSKSVTIFFGASPDANWHCQFDQDADRKRQLLVSGFGGK